MLTSHRTFRRIVTGRKAEWYMLTMVIAFAITVVGTRLYLDITGYPQLGNSTFHFAHALWGGLLQVIAAVLMLIYLNEWVFQPQVGIFPRKIKIIDAMHLCDKHLVNNPLVG